MGHLTHKPWARAVLGAVCVLVGQSLYMLQDPPTGSGIALAMVVGVFGGVMIISVLLDDGIHPHSH